MWKYFLVVVLLLLAVCSGIAVATSSQEAASVPAQETQNTSQECVPGFISSWQSNNSTFYSCFVPTERVNSTMLLHNQRVQGPAYSPSYVIVPSIPTSGARFNYNIGRETYEEGKVHAVNVDNGSLAWTGKFNGTYQYIYAIDKSVYVVSSISVTKFQIDNGERVWSKKILDLYDDGGIFVHKTDNLVSIQNPSSSIIVDGESGENIFQTDSRIEVTYTGDGELNAFTDRGLIKFDTQSGEIIDVLEEIDQTTHHKLASGPSSIELYRSEDYLYFVDNEDLNVEQVPIGDSNLHISSVEYNDGKFRVALLEQEQERDWSPPTLSGDGGASGGVLDVERGYGRSYNRDGTLSNEREYASLSEVPVYTSSYNYQDDNELVEKIDFEGNATSGEYFLDFRDDRVLSTYKRLETDPSKRFIVKSTEVDGHEIVLNSSQRGTAPATASDETLTIKSPDGNEVFREQFDGFSGLIRYGRAIVFLRSSFEVSNSILYTIEIRENQPPVVEKTQTEGSNGLIISDPDLIEDEMAMVADKTLRLKVISQDTTLVNESQTFTTWEDFESQYFELKERTGESVVLVPQNHPNLKGEVSVEIVFTDEFGEEDSIAVSFDAESDTEQSPETERSIEEFGGTTPNAQAPGFTVVASIVALLVSFVILVHRE